MSADRPGTGTKMIIGAFAVSGVLHLVRPRLFATLIPPGLGDPGPWVVGSGVVELVCAAGLATRRPWAPVAAAGTLTAIWVGNIHMARVVQRSDRPGWQKAAAWGRVPLQVPMIRAAWRSPTHA